MESTQDPEESVSRLSSASKLLVLLVIGGIIFSIVYFFFLDDDSAATGDVLTTTEAPAEPQFLKEGELVFLDAETQDTLQQIDIEIATEQKEQQQGLMHRSAMDENQGMLFPYTNAQPRSFYMKNTKISLDIMYADADRRIVTIHQGVMPYSEKSLPSGEPAQYVVEVNAGFATRHGIEEGDFIAFEELSLN
ncbi:MAG: DUF192 domain-containing protein [Tunicatimonas sp.]